MACSGQSHADGPTLTTEFAKMLQSKMADCAGDEDTDQWGWCRPTINGT